MKPQLSNNPETFKTLYKLKERGLYTGEVGNSNFTLRKKGLVNNFHVFGHLNQSGRIVVGAGLIPPTNLMFRVFLLVIIITGFYFYDWIYPPFVAISVVVLAYLLYRLRCRKEIEAFQTLYDLCKRK
ncbi:MAG: hypothetical protein WBG46_11270 [Nonlabens sp.]